MRPVPLLFSSVSQLLLAFAALSACSEDPPPPPPPPPTRLALTAIDGSTGSPIAGAQISLLEKGQLLTTDASGSITVELDPGVYAYSGRAAGYVASPLPGRRFAYVSIIAEQTIPLRVVFEPRPDGLRGSTLSGTVTKDGAPIGGVLVVAGSSAYFSALTDSSGHYAILGVPAGFYNVTGYAAGASSTTKSNVEVTAAAEKTGVDLELTTSAGGTISGRLEGGTGTSSIALVEKSTGDLVPGLSVEGSLGGGVYTIGQVPPGSFRVIGAQELDGVSYDQQWELDNKAPSAMISGTSSVSLDLLFKSTVGGIAPVKSATVTATPTLSWSAVPMANFYVVEIRNVLGQVVVGGFDALGGAREIVLAPATSYTLRNPLVSLTPGAHYSWRVFAAKDVTTGQLFEILSASEELEGSFRVQR